MLLIDGENSKAVVMSLALSSYDYSQQLCAANRLDGRFGRPSRRAHPWLKWAVVWSVATVLSVGVSISIIAAAIMVR